MTRSPTRGRVPAPVSIRGVPLIAAPNGKLYVFGYDTTGGVLEYDTAADTWTPVEPMRPLAPAP